MNVRGERFIFIIRVESQSNASFREQTTHRKTKTLSSLFARFLPLALRSISRVWTYLPLKRTNCPTTPLSRADVPRTSGSSRPSRGALFVCSLSNNEPKGNKPPGGPKGSAAAAQASSSSSPSLSTVVSQQPNIRYAITAFLESTHFALFFCARRSFVPLASPLTLNQSHRFLLHPTLPRAGQRKDQGAER